MAPRLIEEQNNLLEPEDNDLVEWVEDFVDEDLEDENFEDLEDEDEGDIGEIITIRDAEEYEAFIDSGHVVTTFDNINFYNGIIIGNGKSSDDARNSLGLGRFIGLEQSYGGIGHNQTRNIRIDLTDILEQVPFEEKVSLEIWTGLNIDELSMIYVTVHLLRALNDLSYNGQVKGGILTIQHNMANPHLFIRELYRTGEIYPNIIGLKFERILEYFEISDFEKVKMIFPNLVWFQFHKNNIGIFEPTFGEKTNLRDIEALFEDTLVHPFSGAFEGEAIPRVVYEERVSERDYVFDPYDEFMY